MTVKKTIPLFSPLQVPLLPLWKGAMILLFLTMSMSAQAQTNVFTPSFGSPMSVYTAPYSSTMVMGDFDGDGIPDVAVLDLNNGAPSVEIHYGDGAGGFKTAVGTLTLTDSNANIAMTAADLDNDGTSELIFSIGSYLTSPQTSKIRIYDRQSDGTFAQTRLNSLPWTPIDLSSTGILASTLAVGDLTAKGSRDIVVSDSFGSVGVVWIPNDGTGAFGTPTAYAANGCGYYTRPLLVDVNGDGLADVVLGADINGMVTVLLNKGDGTLAAPVEYGSTLSGFRPQSAIVADINGDGHPDIIQTGYAQDTNTFNNIYYLSVSTNNGDGTFATDQTFPYSLNNGSRIGADIIDSADFTGASNYGVVTPFHNPANSQTGFLVSQWTNNGTNLSLARQDQVLGDFNTYSSIVLGYTTTNGSVAFFNNDPHPDVLLGTSGTITGTGTNVYSEFLVFQNAAASAPPSGRDVSFAKANYSVNEGSAISIPVTRGSASTGQVLEYFTVGGTAGQIPYNKANPDYTLIDPTYLSQQVTFGTNEFSKTIQIQTSSFKGKQPDKTLVLTLLEPVGDSDVGPITNTTITITSTNPSTLGKAGALTVIPTNPYKFAHPFPGAPKVGGRTGSDWIFAVNQSLPANASNAVVKVQTSSYPPTSNLWQDYITLTRGKGNAWTGTNRNLPDTTVVYFRIVASADGFPDLVGPPTQSYAVIPGPDLGVIVSIKSDSDHTGLTAHQGETLDYTFIVPNNSSNSAASPAVLSMPIPKNTIFQGMVGSGSLTQMKDKKGNVTNVTCTFSSIPTKTTLTNEINVTVNGPIGSVITANKFTLSAPSQGISAAPVIISGYGFNTGVLKTEILGPIKLTVSPNLSNVDPGGLITYTLRCENDSSVPITNAIVTDEIPAGTELATVYTIDDNGNATDTPLKNPGAFTDPAIIYAKTDTMAKIDLTDPPVSVAELFKLGNFLKAKPGDELDLSGLAQSTVDVLINDGFIAPAKIKWTLPLIPGKSLDGSNVHSVALTVRVPYDAQADVNGSQAFIANGHYNKSLSPASYLKDHSSYDFIIPGSNGSTISALYGNPPTEVDVGINFVPPTPNQPHLFLEKCAKGDQNLNNPNFHGSGFSTIAVLGDVVNVAANHGVDYQLIYRNDVDTNGAGADAHGVVLHDVIPEGMQLCGFFTQNVNDTGAGPMSAEQFTFYDKNGLIIPAVDPNSNSNNMALVRSMDIRLGSFANITTLAKGDHGVIRYTCQPTITPQTVLTFPGWDFDIAPGVVHAFGGFQPGQGLSGKYQGFYISTADQFTPVQGCPDDTVVQVVADVSWDFPAPTHAVNNSQPYDIVPFDFSFTQNGAVSAPNSVINFSVPQGVTFLNSATVVAQSGAVVTLASNSVVADGNTSFSCLPHFVDNNTVVQATQTGTNVQLTLGTVNGHASGTVRCYFQINGPTLDPALKSAGFFAPVNPHIVGTYVAGPKSKILSKALVKNGVSFLAASAGSTQTVDQSAGGSSPQRVQDLNPALLGISRTEPFSVQRGGQFTYTIKVTNHGDSAATNVEVGMQIPWRTTFVSTDNGELDLMSSGGVSPSANPTPYTITRQRDASQIKGTGGGPDIITWHVASLPGQSSVKINLVVKCPPQFADEAIQDHSAYVFADNVGMCHIAADPITVWIFDNDLNESKIQAAQTYFQNSGITVTPELAGAVAQFAKTLTSDSQVQAIAGLDMLQLPSSGVKIIPLGKGQVLLIAQDGNGIVAQGGGNVISNDGGSFTIQGAASAIMVNTGLSGFGTKSAEYLLNNIPSIVAQGGGNIVAAGGGNLISQDGLGIISNEPGGGLLAPASLIANSLTFTADGGRIVAQGGGNIVAAGGGNIVAQGGGNIVAQGGGNILGQDGSGLLNVSSGLVSNASGTLVSNASGTLVSNASGTVIPESGR